MVVGADRIAANGDTANKIGTFSLAVAAHYHNIPFFIAGLWGSERVACAWKHAQGDGGKTSPHPLCWILEEAPFSSH